MRWARKFYDFNENESHYATATVELVTDSVFEVSQVTIQGDPRWIPDSDPSTLPSLEVVGPDLIPGSSESNLNDVTMLVSLQHFSNMINSPYCSHMYISIYRCDHSFLH